MPSLNASNINTKNATNFIVGSDGLTIPLSREVLEKGFQNANFSSFVPRSKGIGYILPNGNKIRIMESAGPAPLRASFTNKNDGAINIFTGKPAQPPSGLNSILRKKFVRENTHIELYND